MKQTVKSMVELTTNAIIVEARVAQSANYPYSGRFYTLEDVEKIIKHVSERIVEQVDDLEIPEPKNDTRIGLSKEQLEHITSGVADSLHDLAVSWAQNCIRDFDFDDKVSLTTDGYGSSIEVRAEFENYDIEDDILTNTDELLERMTKRVESIIVNDSLVEILSDEPESKNERDLVLERIEEGECDSCDAY